MTISNEAVEAAAKEFAAIADPMGDWEEALPAYRGIYLGYARRVLEAADTQAHAEYGEAVEAAHLAYIGCGSWDAKESMRAALEAAAPIIRAECLEEAADELARLPYVKPGAPGRAEYELILAVRRGMADAWLRARAVAERGRQ